MDVPFRRVYLFVIPVIIPSVSAQTIYNWEAEKSRPRQTQLVAIASVRRLGKKQVKALLASQISNEGTSN